MTDMLTGLVFWPMMRSDFSNKPSLILRRAFGRGVTLLEGVGQLLTPRRVVAIGLAASLSIAFLAPLGPLASNRFHRDEAIYSSWGLDIASGRDVLVSGSPVDKPPLFLYVQALSFMLLGATEVAARAPSLVASIVSVGLTFALGRSLYGRGTGALAAFFVAASPFTILFAPTAFTDPMMVALILAGCLAAVRRRWAWSGVALGLAAITKQQGVFFVPLAIGWGLSIKSQTSNPKRQILARFGVTYLIVLGLALGWDVARARQPGFLMQSLVSYGGLSFSLRAIWGQLVGFWNLLGYGTGSSVLNGILLVGGACLLAVDALVLLRHSPARPGAWDDVVEQNQALVDLVIVAFVALFLIGHSMVAFRVWDRYLLGLIPLTSLLLARVLALPRKLLDTVSIPRLGYLLVIVGVLSFTLRPIHDAAASRLPIGGDHGAYQGIEQVVDFFQAVPADTTLYHRWLGWHWRFYLWNAPYDFRAWTSSADLAAQAADRRGSRQYIVFPSWRSSTQARLALDDVGLTMREVHRAFRDDGSISFVVYHILEAP